MKKWKFLTAVAALTLMLGACNSDDDSATGESTEKDSTSAATDTAEKSAFPMKISSLTASSEDEEKGTTITFEDVTLDKMPERIITLDYGFLDTLDALGVEGIVGIAANGGKGNIPPHLKEKYVVDGVADVGTLKQIDFEAVAAAEPDVIFISGRQAPFYEELKEITPNVVFIGSDNENYINAVNETVDLAAQIFDKETEAEKLKADLQAKVDEVKEKAAGYENALVAMYNDKKISGFDNGADSRFAYVYNDFGFKPATTDIEASSHGSDFSYESVLSVDPEVLLIIDRTASDVDAIKADIENDIIKQTRAYKEGKIVYLDGVNWYFSSNGVTTETEKLDEILNELK
ncbi:MULTISPECIES: siderophore ABC transporter substrate-binding protein [unclassified Psychrobacillus]|uniref:siderophore ABC transporter substrate-binding protein n=1 Tax=unclassified Psychrobacillus TaxID=2636677 RepID=UPI00146BFB9E|nr:MULTISPECIES: siderophore ABC transporter substrate-binding protein [unclassified Psychrobacillus]MCM3358284.1 siderophore ABC transporter substrate-binding protein [Psychrobacillus sp. MER TA 171]NME05533.1 siderophore ABC transporter substrate-binding protein [Psychrobacillus sp. BL-248-WT-3]